MHRQNICQLICSFIIQFTLGAKDAVEMTTEDIKRKLFKIPEGDWHTVAFHHLKGKGYEDVRKDVYHELGGRENPTYAELTNLLLVAIETQNITALKDIAKNIDTALYVKNMDCLEEFQNYFNAITEGKLVVPNPLTVVQGGKVKSNVLDDLVKPGKEGAKVAARSKTAANNVKNSEQEKDTASMSENDNEEEEEEEEEEDITNDGPSSKELDESEWNDNEEEEEELLAFEHLSELLNEKSAEELKELRANYKAHYDVYDKRRGDLSETESAELEDIVACVRAINQQIKKTGK